MNIVAKLVKETVLLPYRIAQGIGAAVSEATDPKEKRNGS